MDLQWQFTLKSKIHIFVAVALLIHLDCFGVNCQVLEISAIEMSAFSWR